MTEHVSARPIVPALPPNAAPLHALHLERELLIDALFWERVLCPGSDRVAELVGALRGVEYRIAELRQEREKGAK